MSTSNTPDKTFVSSNFINFNLIKDEDRFKIKKAQSDLLDSMPPETIEQGAEGILQQYIKESGNDPELVAQAFEVLTNLNVLGGYERLQLVSIMADLINKGLT